MSAASPERTRRAGAVRHSGPEAAASRREGRRRRARGSGSGSARAWLAALGLLCLGALGLRLWGIGHGLPFVYNADENAHFVPRAIGMFGHSYNPGYFINPPAFTYVLHAAFALRFGSREAVGDALASDPGSVFGLARVVAAGLGTLAVGLLAWAGARLAGGVVGLLAAAVLGVAFLPVHYAHLALNDVPALAGLGLCLVGVGGILRGGGLGAFALAGAALGVACATKYTAGIAVLAILAAGIVAPVGGRARARGLALAGFAALAGFVVANPYALLDFEAFRAGLEQQSSASNDGGGKLGVTEEDGILYYLGTLSWGLGWIPAGLAVAGAGWLLARREDRALALVLVPAPVLLLLFLGLQDRYFARWLLPAYPFLCLLAGVGAVRLAALVRSPRPAWGAKAALAVLLLAQGVVTSIHNDRVLAREDTRGLARDWLVANVPEGTKVVVEPIAPDQWATDPGRPSSVVGNGARWRKWPTARSEVRNDGTRIRGQGRLVKLEDYERTLRPELIDAYVASGYCWVVSGSTQAGRAFAEPAEVPGAIAYYAELARRAEEVHRVRPWADGVDRVPFSFDHTFTAYPLAYERPGPEVVVRRLRGCR